MQIIWDAPCQKFNPARTSQVDEALSKATGAREIKVFFPYFPFGLWNNDVFICPISWELVCHGLRRDKSGGLQSKWCFCFRRGSGVGWVGLNRRPHNPWYLAQVQSPGQSGPPPAWIHAQRLHRSLWDTRQDFRLGQLQGDIPGCLEKAHSSLRLPTYGGLFTQFTPCPGVYMRGGHTARWRNFVRAETARRRRKGASSSQTRCDTWISAVRQVSAVHGNGPDHARGHCTFCSQNFLDRFASQPSLLCSPSKMSMPKCSKCDPSVTKAFCTQARFQLEKFFWVDMSRRRNCFLTGILLPPPSRLLWVSYFTSSSLRFVWANHDKKCRLGRVERSAEYLLVKHLLYQTWHFCLYSNTLSSILLRWADI